MFVFASAAFGQSELLRLPFSRTVVEDFESLPDWTVTRFALEEWGTRIDDPELDLRVEIRPGAPADIRNFEDGGLLPVELGTQQSVLGLRIESSRAARHGILVAPVNPPVLEAVPVGIDLWVSGDNSNHELELLLLDDDGNPFAHVYLGRTNSAGWMLVSQEFRLEVPKAARPLRLGGFVLKTEPLAMQGVEYLYFDALIMTFPAEPVPTPGDTTESRGGAGR